MNYFLKILGDSKMNGGDPVPFFEDSGSLFWKSECTVILSKVAAGMVCRGDILIQYIPKTLKNKEWAGRVIGCYRATYMSVIDHILRRSAKILIIFVG